MASMGRRNPGSGFGGPRYPGTFLLALREALEAIRWQATAWKGSSVECLDPQEKKQEIGLDNLYRRLRQEPRDQWPKLLAELLGSLPPDIAEPPTDLQDVAEQLLVRLGPPVARQMDDADVWTCSLVEGHLTASLVIDHATSMSYVTRKMIEASGKDGDHWYERAVANLRGRSDGASIVQVHEESGLLQSQVGDAYDSSRGLLLDLLLPGHEEDGFYVIVPGRDHLLVLPVGTQTIMLAPWLRAIAAKMCREIPYPISPELFWVCDGTWHVFTIETVGDDLFVKPPAAFAEVMARLRPDAFDDEPGSESPGAGNDFMPD